MNPRRFLALLLLGFCLAAATFAVSEKDVSIQGLVYIVDGKARLARTNHKDTSLSSGNPLIAATFEDSRLSGKRMKLEGRFLADGSFDIKQFYVIHGDALYRLIYFCNT